MVYNSDIYYGQIPLKKIYKDNKLLWERFSPVSPGITIDETKISILLLDEDLEPIDILLASTDHSEVSTALHSQFNNPAAYPRLELYFGSQISPTAVFPNDYAALGNVYVCHLSNQIIDMQAGFMNNCPKLTKVNFTRNPLAVSLPAGVYVPANISQSSLVDIGGPIPGNIKTFYGGCLQYARITELAFEEGAETFKAGCFANCDRISGTVEIPSSVLEIEQGAFYGCTGIERLVIHKSADQVTGSSYAPWGATNATVAWDP